MSPNQANDTKLGKLVQNQIPNRWEFFFLFFFSKFLIVIIGKIKSILILEDQNRSNEPVTLPFFFLHGKNS